MTTQRSHIPPFPVFPGADRLRARVSRIRFSAGAKIRGWLADDLANLAPWAPVAIGIGVGAYFGLKTEPPPIVGWAALGVALFFLAAAPRLRAVSSAIALAALGFVAADWRADRVAAPVVDRELGIRSIEGRVVSVERGLRGERLVVALHAVEGLIGEETPQRARITWRGPASAVRAGDHVAFRAGLGPPPAPAVPGGFDFGRQLYFQRIGAVGFAVTAPQPLSAPPARGADQRIENIRSGLASRITAAAPGQGGAIVAAVVTGKRDAISEESRAALRDAGLAHLLAISGLHMGLATGLIFFAVRAALAAIEPIAVRFPIKKWAAAAALLSGFAYLLLSGAAWSPRRAFIMAAIMFAAILFDRRALSLRNIAIAATIVLLTTPEALVHPGFQMSFAAAAALIAGFEWWTRRADPDRSFSVVARLKRYAIGLALTDLVASLATAPFALYHFNRVAVFSLPANVLAMPLMAFWIMPAAVIGLILTPFGLDQLAWAAAAKGVDVVLAIGGEVSSWPNAVRLTVQWPTTALIALSAGGLWLLLARSPLRLAGLVGAPVAWLLAAAASPPDLFVAASGENAGVVLQREHGPAVAPYAERKDRFSIKVWNEAIGAAAENAGPVSIADIGSCGREGCVAEVNGALISVIEDPIFLAEDCARAAVVVALFPVSGQDWRACKAILIDKRSVWRRGAHAVWIEGEAISVRSVTETRGVRPWAPASP